LKLKQGINLKKSKIDKETIITLIIGFCLMTPIGIIFGLAFTGFSENMEAIFLSISAGR
jgi:hypothetical protein